MNFIFIFWISFEVVLTCPLKKKKKSDILLDQDFLNSDSWILSNKWTPGEQ